MKNNYLFSLSAILIQCFCGFNSFSQVNQDDILKANSDKWKVNQKKGLFGLSKPEFGDYTTLDIVKLDSGRMKKKTRDSSSLSFETSGSGGSDWDQSKFLTIKKNRIFKLRLISKVDTTKADTIKTIFAIASETKEKKQTFLGKILSKNDEGKDEALNDHRNVPGIIITNDNEKPWQFFIENFSGNYISSGYLKNEKDSFSIQMNQRSFFDAGFVLKNNEGTYLALIKLKSEQKPDYILIRHDLDPSYRQAIAALFAVIIGIKDF